MGDVIDNKDFTVIKPFAFWTQHVLPLVYGDEISYMETLDKVVKLLNELIKNNNKLPDYIQQIVEEYITGGPLEEVLSGILANFILNVKYPPTGITPAKGDGTANDYEAIQGCIDYAANMGGGVVYFPFGKYLTSKLTLKPGVSLMGFGKYCTSIVLTGGETGSLISGTVNDCGIYNLTLDGNMSIQVNDVDVVTLTGYDIQLMNVILTDGFTLFNIEKTGDNIEINNVEFRYAVESMLRIGGNVGSVNADSVTFGSLSTISGVAAIISDSDNDVITGIVSNKVLPLFAELDGNNNVLKGKVASTNLISGDGQNNVYDFYCRAKNETYSGDVVETVHGNKSVHISGMSTWAVDNNSTESIDGTKSEVVTGVSSAQYNDDRIINGKNITETFSGKKILKANDYKLDLANPLTYKTPTQLSKYFKSIPFKDDTDVYQVLVETEYTKLLHDTFVDPLNYGAIGDGITDDSDAIIEASKHGTICNFTNTFKIDKNIILDSSIYGCTFHLAPLASITVNGKFILNSTFYSDASELPTARGTYALIINNNSDCVINNCEFRDIMNAIHTEDSDNIIITNNRLKNIIQTASNIGGNGYGIVSTHCNNMIIASNIFLDVARHCIYLTVEDNDPGCENVTITNNQFIFKDVTTRTATELPIQTRNAKYIDINNNYFYNSYGCLWIIAQTTTTETESHDIIFRSNTAINCKNSLRPNDDGCIVFSGTDNNSIHDIIIKDNYITSYNVSLLKISYKGSALVENNVFFGEYVSKAIEIVSVNTFNSLIISNNYFDLERTDNTLLHFYSGALNAGSLKITNNELKIQHLFDMPHGFSKLEELIIINNTITNIIGTDYFVGTINNVTCLKNSCNTQTLIKNAKINSIKLSNDSNNIVFFITRADLANANPKTTSESGYSLSKDQVYNGTLLNSTLTNLEALPTTGLRFGQIAITSDKHVYIWANEWIALN